MARPRKPSRSPVTLRWAGVAVLALVALLYYRPLRAYVDTHGTLSSRRSEVHALESQNRQLEHRLAASTSRATLEREARRLGYVRGGEHLYIVQGIDAWRKHLRATLRSHG
jgi:Septum formation initiator